MMRLRHQQFATVDDVNEAIAPLLAQLNAKAFQKLPGSRASRFAQLDHTAWVDQSAACPCTWPWLLPVM